MSISHWGIFPGILIESMRMPSVMLWYQIDWDEFDATIRLHDHLNRVLGDKTERPA